MVVSPVALFHDLMLDLHDACPSFLSLKDRSSGTESWITPREAAALSISRSFLKKYQEKASESADAAALAKFLTVNDNCKNWKLDVQRLEDDLLIGELRAELYRFASLPGGGMLGDDDVRAFYRGRVGPGASVGSLGTDFYTKLFAGPITSTSSYLYRLYKREVWEFSQWSCAEIIRSEHYGEPVLVSGNRLNFVPKNDEISRSICVEPSLNMYFQLGHGSEIEDRLRSVYKVDLSLQPVHNRELARLGSMYGTFSTTDLASASDSMSLGMLEAVLPSVWYRQLVRLRSRTSTLPTGQTVDLNMVSTMGNGFTFPLQTALFCAAVNAVANVSGLPLIHGPGTEKNWGVFGDDIIVPTHLTRRLHRLLELLGFEINHSKTFVEGPFRESCGGDYFLGNPIRGVYLKTLRTKQDRFSAINRLNQFSALTGIRLARVIQSLMNSVPFQPVPLWENEDSGVRWPRYMCTLPSNKNGSTLYRADRPVTAKLRVMDGYIKTPFGLRRRMWNPDGLYLALLQGSLRSYSIPVRHDRVKYVTKRLIAPYWSDESAARPFEGGQLGRRLETAIHFNCC